MAFYKPTRHHIRFELAPLIDIIFILIIFFAISTTLITQQKGLKLQLPAAKTVSSHQKGLHISIDSGKLIYLNRKKITISQIKGAISSQMKADPKLQVTLNADQKTPYVLLIHVLDEIRQGGCYNIVLEAKKKTA
ncbi:MAG: biopolymer transporter ExbD [Candidatus Margulisbacteria bacterium]|nr:biopolymer transporter ExbD [Candidatus Margulisiibacteriota bacterium]